MKGAPAGEGPLGAAEPSANGTRPHGNGAGGGGGRVPLDEPFPPDEPVDLLAAFRPLITSIRWGMVAVGLVLAAPDVLEERWHVPAWGCVLAAYALGRTFRPIRYAAGRTRGLVAVLGEVALNLTAVAATGYWDSPYVFSLMTAVIVAGFARGLGFSVRLVVVSTAAIAVPYLSDVGLDDREVRLSAQWAIELLLVALVASYARRLFGEAQERHVAALDRVSRLAEANTLLSALHKVAQGLPASLDLDEVLDSTLASVRDLFDYGSAAVLLRDETGASWIVAASEGTRFPASLTDANLPRPLRQAAASDRPLSFFDLPAQTGGGLNGLAHSGLYAPLRARGDLVGLLAIEHPDVLHFTERDEELLQGFTEAAALAVDNARWFERLRTVGADQERLRIARELHDRIGQSLAYLAFELDRLARVGRDTALHEDLQQLRQDVRQVVSEVRETLYDLRTDVSETQSLIEILESFLDRVRARSGLAVSFRHHASARPPLPQERELWRIAQEAVANAERHAGARHISVSWECDERRALLQVADDGRGFPLGTTGRMDAYGILGMRERADSIGARLEVVSAPGRGTRVRCRLDLKETTR
jgi:signal transduction histidine kinase